MARIKLSDEDVIGLATNDPYAVERIVKLAQATTRDPYTRRGPRVDSDDVVQTAVLDALESIQQGKCRTGEELTQEVKRSVWRTTKRFQRQIMRSQKREISGDLVPEGLFPLGPSPDQLFDAKESLELQRASGDSLVHLLYQDSKTAKEEARARIDLVTVDSELITYFKRNPERMYQLDPNKFEELVAALLKDLGYDIELTKPGPDGGIDIIATQKTGVGEMLLLVDCKRYAPRRPVGVGIVRALFGITEQLRASMGLLATTSFFTKPAREFQKTVRHRISLKDYSDLIGWLNLYGAGMHR